MLPRRLVLVAPAAIAVFAILLALGVLPSLPARALPPAGTDILNVSGEIVGSSRLGSETIPISGTLTVQREAPHLEGDVEVVDFEVIAIDITGQSVTGTINITANPGFAVSTGEIRSLQASPMYPASSFFDIFLNVMIPASPLSTNPLTRHNEEVLHVVPMESGLEVPIDAWPPIGFSFEAEPNPPAQAGSEPQTFPVGEPHCTSGLPLLPALPAKLCLDSVTIVVEGATTPTPTTTPTQTPTPCPTDACTPTPTITLGPSPTPTWTPFPILSPTPTSTPVSPPDAPSFSVAPGGPSGLHPANLVGLSGEPVPINGNDNFANASVISSLPYTSTQSTVDATMEFGEPDNPAGCITFFPAIKGATVWYQYTPPVGATLTANTFGSNFDTVLAVYTGASVGALTPIVCNDDSGSLQSQVTFLASPDTTYYFQTGGFDSRTGNLRLTVTTPNVGGAGLAQFTTVGCGQLGLGEDGCDDGTDGDQDDINALSYGQDFEVGEEGISFSVAAGSQGLPGTGVAEQAACVPAQPQADQFSSLLDGTNASVFDGDGLGGDCQGATSFGLTEVPESDDVDALIDQNVQFADADADGTPDEAVFFSLAAGSPTLVERGRDAADVLWTVGGLPLGLYVAATTLGLQPGDDINALCIADQGAGSPSYNPASDMLLFSLAPGSPTLAALGASAADVIGPGPVVVHEASELGLRDSDNLDALTCSIGETPTPTPTVVPAPVIGDANCNDVVDAVDSLLVLQFDAGLLALLSCPFNADTNQDGQINSLDSILILQFVAGFLNQLPP